MSVNSKAICHIPQSLFEMTWDRGARVAQSVVRPTSAQIMMSRFPSSSPASGSVLTAQSLEPAWDSASPSLSAPPRLLLCLSLSIKITLDRLKVLETQSVPKRVRDRNTVTSPYEYSLFVF